MAEDKSEPNVQSKDDDKQVQIKDGDQQVDFYKKITNAALTPVSNAWNAVSKLFLPRIKQGKLIQGVARSGTVLYDEKNEGENEQEKVIEISLNDEIVGIMCVPVDVHTQCPEFTVIEGGIEHKYVHIRCRMGNNRKWACRICIFGQGVESIIGFPVPMVQQS